MPSSTHESPWRFRIVIPTSDRYATTALPVVLHLLRRYWPDHPAVDVLHYDVRPGERDRITNYYVGRQEDVSWTKALARYLETSNGDSLVLLMLDDYALCGEPNRKLILEACDAIQDDPAIGVVHLTWQPAQPKTPHGKLLRVPPWEYSVSTQAAIWRREFLLHVAREHLAASIQNFEHAGSRWFNKHRAGLPESCQAAIPEPPNPSPFVDETDKSGWVLPYHNLMRQGSFDRRHAEFLKEQGFVFVHLDERDGDG